MFAEFQLQSPIYTVCLSLNSFHLTINSSNLHLYRLFQSYRFSGPATNLGLSFKPIATVKFYFLPPYRGPSTGVKFEEGTCRILSSEQRPLWDDLPTCSCGKNCNEEYPCLTVQVCRRVVCQLSSLSLVSLVSLFVLSLKTESSYM